MPIMPSEDISVINQIRDISRHFPAREAARDESGAVTYTGLYAAVGAISGWLRQMGVAPGDRVATLMHPSVPHLTLVLGCMAAGAVAVPLSIRLTPVELGLYIAPLNLTLILADPDHAPKTDALGVAVQRLDHIDDHAALRDRLEPVWSDRPAAIAYRESDPALIIATGGTTGISKGAVYTHRSLYLWLSACLQDGGRIRTDVELFFSPFFHAGIVTGCMVSLFCGARTVILRSFSADRSLEEIARGTTFMVGTPITFNLLRQHPDFERVDRSSLRSVAIGGAPADPAFFRQVMADFANARLRHGYGATEFGPVTGITHEDFQAGRAEGVGRALQGCHIRIEDDGGREVPIGERGEIVVRTPWQTLGYWGRDEETAATYSPNGIKLGDLGVMEADGWIRIAGRKKEMIISGGENIFPNEVENVLIAHPSVRAICIYGVDDAHWGERVEAAVVLNDGASLTLADLTTFGRSQLAGYKLPKTLQVRDEIPLTTMSKQDRRRLKLDAEAAAR